MSPVGNWVIIYWTGSSAYFRYPASFFLPWSLCDSLCNVRHWWTLYLLLNFWNFCHIRRRQRASVDHSVFCKKWNELDAAAVRVADSLAFAFWETFDKSPKSDIVRPALERARNSYAIMKKKSARMEKSLQSQNGSCSVTLLQLIRKDRLGQSWNSSSRTDDCTGSKSAVEKLALILQFPNVCHHFLRIRSCKLRNKEEWLDVIEAGKTQECDHGHLHLTAQADLISRHGGWVRSDEKALGERSMLHSVIANEALLRKTRHPSRGNPFQPRKLSSRKIRLGRCIR